MYPVSKAFQEAIRKPQRITSVRGALHLKDVSGQKGFDESAIVQKSLQITDQLNSGKFGYGSAYSRNMSVKLDYTKINDVEGVNINLTNATISLWFKLTLADGTEEEILLGNFLIDSAKSSRKFNILSIYANDYLPKLGVPSVPVSNFTPYQIFTEACGLSKQGTGNEEAFVNALPNGNKTFTFDTSQIQTAWDMVMWVSQITGTFVRAKRQDEPCPQLVQIPTKYTKSSTSENFDLETFKADNGSIIPADVRFSTDFTDTSIRNTTLLMNVKGKMFKSHRNWTFAPDTLEGTLELKSNPLLEGKTESEIQAILDNIQDYTDDLRFCPFKTTFNGNPAIEVGDFVYLEPGGAVDETKYRHYGIVTYSKWVYRGKCEIRCVADVTAERPKSTSSASAKSGMQRAAAQAAEDTYTQQPKSQLEKRVDALSRGRESSETDRIKSGNNELVISTSGSNALVSGIVSGRTNFQLFLQKKWYNGCMLRILDNYTPKIMASIIEDGIKFYKIGDSSGSSYFEICTYAIGEKSEDRDGYTLIGYIDFSSMCSLQLKHRLDTTNPNISKHAYSLWLATSSSKLKICELIDG